MKKHIDVVAALIKKENSFYICQRSSKMSLPLMWEFPGGKIEVNESKKDALIREIKEELSCNVKVGSHIDTSFYEYETFTINLSVFQVELHPKELPSISEHCDYAWITVEEFDQYHFAPADLAAIEKIKELYAK